MSTVADLVANEFDVLRSSIVTDDEVALEACRKRVQAAVDEQAATVIELRRLVAYQQAELDSRPAADEEILDLSGGDFRVERTIVEALEPIVGLDLALAAGKQVEGALTSSGWRLVHASTPRIRT